jgi:hypothetical protein
MDSSYYGEKSAPSSPSYGISQLSQRNIAPMPPQGGGSAPGNDAEAYETTEYNGTIETRNLKKDCATLLGLKARKEVIFESVGEYRQGCSFVFKVERARAEEILAIVKGLDPKELSVSTYTIKGQIEDFTSETDILKNKLATIDDTLRNAVSAYDEITALATRTKDVESLAKIIESKLQIVERLTQERINIGAQLERLSRAKLEQLDRLDYTYFRLSVVEKQYVDIVELKDSWKEAIRSFVRNANDAAQAVSVSLAGFIIVVLSYALYALILIIAAKYGWKFIVYIWKK